MARFLLLHGFGGIGPDHWLVWLSQELRAQGHVARMRKLPKPNEPVLDDWLETMTERLIDLDENVGADGGGELIVIAHSLGVRLWLHHALLARPGLPVADRVALVAPPQVPAEVKGATAFGEIDHELGRLDPSSVALATRAVISTNDPYWPEGGAIPGLAEPLGLPVDDLGHCGHFEPDDDFGPWPGMLAWCLGEAESVEL